MGDFSREFGERLRNERNRLGVNQAQFAEFGGVTKLTQLKYEKGERVPSVEYLYGIHQKGADFVYLLTGERWLGGAPTGHGAGAVIDTKALASIIEIMELGLQSTGILWPAKYKAEIISTFYGERDVFDWDADDGESKLKAAEAVVKVLTQLGQLKNTSQ